MVCLVLEMNSISQNPTTLESDPDFDSDSNYSDYTSGFESDSTSLKRSAKNYVYENGRRYNGYKEGEYRWPNDETEQDRLDLHHNCFLIARRGELFACPLGQQSLPQGILNVGTGTGIWVMDIADRLPSTQVIAVNLSPIQPTSVHPKLTFDVDDIEEDWQYRDNSFDFIHVRSRGGAIYDWPKFYRQAFKAPKLVGWIELQDYGEAFSVDGNSLAQDYILNRWAEFPGMAIEKASSKPFFNVASKHGKCLEEFGYVDVT
ncbi:hypothetical protein RUND412_007507 [Rhizina undulata]